MKRPTTPTIDYFVERRGYWTEVEFKDGQLVVRRCHRMPWIIWALSLLIVALLVWPLLLSPVGIAVLLIIAGFMATAWNGQRIADRKRFPIVVCDNAEKATAEYVHGQFFRRKHVRKIIVRENKNRQGSDVQLVQIYMKVKEVDKLVLLYQQAWTVEAKEKAEKLANTIRDWLISSD